MKLEDYKKAFGNISSAGFDNLNAIVDYCHIKGTTDIRSVAYILATVYHETGHTFLPVEEIGKGAGLAYGKPRPNGKVYFGRGYTQITWEENYSKFGKLLNIDLLGHPEMALDPKIALQIAYIGMTKGAFTGKKLSDYFNNEKTDYLNARRIINSLDKADLIAGYALKFYTLLTI